MHPLFLVRSSVLGLSLAAAAGAVDKGAGIATMRIVRPRV